MEVSLSLSLSSPHLKPQTILITDNRLPEDKTNQKGSLEYYIWLAKLAEKGKITGIFFADVYGVDDAFPGQVEAQFRSGSNCAQMDPIVFVSAMASVTKSVCFGVTGITSYISVRFYFTRFAEHFDRGIVLIFNSHSFSHEPT